MKKIAVLFAVAAVAALTGCPSNSAQACVKTAECAEEEDPAAFCQDADDECTEDEDCAKTRDACTAQTDALSVCTLANGKCEDKVFSAGDECETETEAFLECFADNA